MRSEVSIGPDGRHITRTSERLGRQVVQKLCVPRWALRMFARWVDSEQIDLGRHVPLEAFSRPVETIRTRREVER